MKMSGMTDISALGKQAVAPQEPTVVHDQKLFDYAASSQGMGMPDPATANPAVLFGTVSDHIQLYIEEDFTERQLEQEFRDGLFTDPAMVSFDQQPTLVATRQPGEHAAGYDSRELGGRHEFDRERRPGGVQGGHGSALHLRTDDQLRHVARSMLKSLELGLMTKTIAKAIQNTASSVSTLIKGQ
jgi:hypothetical protein